MVSKRANNYLSTLHRLPAINDRQIIEAAFHAVNLPPIEALIEFQREFGGYVSEYYADAFVWGIIHEAPYEHSVFEPNKIAVDLHNSKSGGHLIYCANCHPSYDWQMDLEGAVYINSSPFVSSFAHKIERESVVWEFSDKNLRPIQPQVSDLEFREMLLPLVEDGRIEEASDFYMTLYSHRGVYVAVNDNKIGAFLIDESGRSLLTRLPIEIEGDNSI